MSTFIDAIQGITRVGMHEGTPQYRVDLTALTSLRTKRGAGVNFQITNFAPGATDGGKPVRITTNERNEIIGCELAPVEEEPQEAPSPILAPEALQGMQGGPAWGDVQRSQR